jgi:hypothetical protein
MRRSIYAHMLASAFLCIDPEEKIDAKRSIQHLLLHFAGQHKNSPVVGGGKPR